MQPLPAASAASPLKASITKQIIAPCSSPPAMLIKADRGKPSSLQRLWYMMKKYNRRAWIHLQAELLHGNSFKNGFRILQKWHNGSFSVYINPLWTTRLLGLNRFFFWNWQSCAGIFKQSMVVRNRVGIELSYRPARLHRLAKLIPWNRFLGSLKV